MDRIYFQNHEDCLKFFNEVKLNNKIKSWKQLAIAFGTSRSMLDKYRYGLLCMPEDRFQILLNMINTESKDYFSMIIKRKNKNWGQILGGKKAYEINKTSFDIGRKLPKRVNRTPKYKFDINMILSEDLCEFVGVVIGDGFTNKYGRMCQTQITGDRRLDSEYYYTTLKQICEKLFNISPKIYETDKNNSIRLNIFSKLLFTMLTNRFGIPAGEKSHTVVIPEEILKADNKFLNATLRGMFNTDGGVGFDRRKIYKKPYVRVNYTSVSLILVRQLSEILSRYEIRHSVHMNKSFFNTNPSFQIQINGAENVKLFMSKIGFSNPRSLDKVKYLISSNPA